MRKTKISLNRKCRRDLLDNKTGNKNVLQSYDHPHKIENDGIIKGRAEAVNQMVPDQHDTCASSPQRSSDELLEPQTSQKLRSC